MISELLCSNHERLALDKEEREPGRAGRTEVQCCISEIVFPERRGLNSVLSKPIFPGRLLTSNEVTSGSLLRAPLRRSDPVDLLTLGSRNYKFEFCFAVTRLTSRFTVKGFVSRKVVGIQRTCFSLWDAQKTMERHKIQMEKDAKDLLSHGFKGLRKTGSVTFIHLQTVLLAGSLTPSCRHPPSPHLSHVSLAKGDLYPILDN